MTTKLDQLEHEIALAERAVADATTANHAAGVELARQPGSLTVLKDAREAAQKLAAAQADLEMLRAARVAAQAADTADAEAAARAKAIGHLEAVERLLAERQEAAKGIDAALSNLKGAMQVWAEVGRAITDEAGGFFRITLQQHPRKYEYTGAATALVDAAVNAIAAEVHSACQGVNAHRCMTFNYLRQQCGAAELVVTAAEDSAKTLKAQVNEIAKQRGLLQ